MDKSTPLCKSDSDALTEYLLKFSQKDSGFHRDVPGNIERFESAVEVLENLFEGSVNDHFQLDIPCDSNSSAGGVVVRSNGLYITSFDADDPEKMELLRRFLQNVDAFYVAALNDRNDPTKVLLMLDWRVENVKER